MQNTKFELLVRSTLCNICFCFRTIIRTSHIHIHLQVSAQTELLIDPSYSYTIQITEKNTIFSSFRSHDTGRTNLIEVYGFYLASDYQGATLPRENPTRRYPVSDPPNSAVASIQYAHPLSLSCQLWLYVIKLVFVTKVRSMNGWPPYSFPKDLVRIVSLTYRTLIRSSYNAWHGFVCRNIPAFRTLQFIAIYSMHFYLTDLFRSLLYSRYSVQVSRRDFGPGSEYKYPVQSHYRECRHDAGICEIRLTRVVRSIS